MEFLIVEMGILLLLNIMFHAPMGRFQLELIYNYTYFSIVVEVSTPTRVVENVVLTTKGLQERNTQMFDGTTVEK